MPASLPKPEPVAVSRFEFNLLRILNFLVGTLPAQQASTVLYSNFIAPGCLSPAAVRLVEDTLAKGCIQFLVRSGGWRVDRFLRNAKPIEGRVWERLPIEDRKLELSPITLSFLIWLTSENPTKTKTLWNPTAGNMSTGDALFFLLAHESLRNEPEILGVLSGKHVFVQNPLLAIAYPGLMGYTEESSLDFSDWMTGSRAAILECLQPWLQTIWIRNERNKGQISDWKQMRRIGQSELVALSRYVSAADRAGRPDLTRFILRANAQLLSVTGITSSFWTGGLQSGAPVRLAERIETQRAALALPRQLENLRTWEQRARSVSFFDENYSESQFWKQEWDHHEGERISRVARELVETLDPLHAH
jgi:hypothetical protein